MSFDDLSISNISKGASVADLAEKEAGEWKFSDCLRLHLRDNSLFDENQGEYSRKSSLDEQFDENNSINNSEKENQPFGSASLDPQGKNMPKQISQKNTCCVSPIRVLRQNNTLQNIPEVEAEETPLNTHSQMPSYLRNTISFSQHSADISSGSQSQKKKRTSHQKNDRENQYFTLDNRNSLTSTVRRLFMSDQQNIGGYQTPLSSGCTPTQKSLWSNSQKDIQPKVDSNRKGKVYHDEIVRKNKAGGSEQMIQGGNTSCITAADSGDLLMGNLVNSVLLSNAMITNNNGGQNYENFHSVLAAPNQNENVKLQYYEYLLEEAQITQEHFVNRIASIIDQEKEAFSPGERINSQLLEGIENQRNRINALESEVVSLRGRAAQLSQLVVQYRQQIIRMNEESAETSQQIKLMQDQLSTLTLMLQLGNDYSISSSESIQELSLSHESSQIGIHAKLEDLKQKVGLFLSNANQVQINAQRIEQFREQLRELMVIGNIDGKEVLDIYQQPLELKEDESEEEHIIKSIKIKLERLQEDLTQAQRKELISQQKEEEIQQTIYELQSYKKQAEQISQQEKHRFEDIISVLRKQISMLREQQSRLDKQLQGLKIDKKLHFHEELVKQLKCRFEHQINHPVDISGITMKNTQEQTQTQQHQHQNNQTDIICDMLKVLDQLESGISITSDGSMQINEDLLNQINCNHLKNWTSTFMMNIQILIQSLIKRQIDKQLLQYPQYTEEQRFQLKKLIYKGKYEEYFEHLFEMLKSQPLQHSL